MTGWSALAFAHRWLGIAGGLLFIVWFVSGVAMMYVRMPEVTLAERLARSPAIDPAALQVSPSEAARVAGLVSPGAVQLTMLGRRPVYRFSGRTLATVFADRPEQYPGPSPGEALAHGRAFARAAENIRYDGWNRWLYRGLHSLDLPFLHNRRPAWDLVVIALSAGGLVGAAASLVPAWRRLGRHAARLRHAVRLKARPPHLR